MSIYERLCIHDERNPLRCEDDEIGRAESCGCDACMRGTDQLAQIIIEQHQEIANLRDELRATRNDARRLKAVFVG